MNASRLFCFCVILAFIALTPWAAKAELYECNGVWKNTPCRGFNVSPSPKIELPQKAPEKTEAVLTAPSLKKSPDKNFLSAPSTKRTPEKSSSLITSPLQVKERAKPKNIITAPSKTSPPLISKSVITSPTEVEKLEPKVEIITAPSNTVSSLTTKAVITSSSDIKNSQQMTANVITAPSATIPFKKMKTIIKAPTSGPSEEDKRKAEQEEKRRKLERFRELSALRAEKLSLVKKISEKSTQAKTKHNITIDIAPAVALCKKESTSPEQCRDEIDDLEAKLDKETYYKEVMANLKQASELRKQTKAIRDELDSITVDLK